MIWWPLFKTGNICSWWPSMRAEKSKNPSFENPWRPPHFYDERSSYFDVQLLGFAKRRVYVEMNDPAVRFHKGSPLRITVVLSQLSNFVKTKLLKRIKSLQYAKHKKRLHILWNNVSFANWTRGLLPQIAKLFQWLKTRFVAKPYFLPGLKECLFT